MNRRRWAAWGVFLAVSVWMAAPSSLRAAAQTTIHVHVTDAKTGDPIYQAHLTLKFRKPGGFMRRPEVISYSAKTDKKGLCSFPYVLMGEITLMVTAPDHESYGKVLKVNKDNPLFEVRLKNPKPQL